MGVSGIDDLVTWLRAQLDEDERVALRVADRYRIRNPDSADDGQPYWPLPSVEACFRGRIDPDIAAGLELIKAYGPAHVLADVDAKRRHIARWEHVNELLAAEDKPSHIRNELLSVRRAYWLVIADDALPYAGRDGWQTEWATTEPG